MPQRDFGIIGLGRFGTAVAVTLVELGHSVLGVDKDMGTVQQVSPLITHAVQADATDPEVLRSLGFRNFDTVVVSIGPGLEESILITVLIKELGVEHVIAKARSPLHGKVLERVGADRVVYPEREMGVRVAHRIASPSILDVIQLSEDLSVVEAVAPEVFVTKTLKELNLRARHGLTVLAIKRGSHLISLVGPDTRVETDDIMVVAGRKNDLTRFESFLATHDED